MSFVNGVSPNTLRFYSLAAFLIGLLQPATIVFIGKMPLSEPLMFIVLLHCAIVLAQARALPVPTPLAEHIRHSDGLPIGCVRRLCGSGYLAPKSSVRHDTRLAANDFPPY